MIHYLDRTFCNNEKCKNKSCFRFFSDSHRKTSNYFGLPVAFGSFDDACNRKVEIDDTKLSDTVKDVFILTKKEYLDKYFEYNEDTTLEDNDKNYTKIKKYYYNTLKKYQNM